MFLRIFAIAAALLTSLLPESAAAALPTVICNNIPGCGDPPINVITEAAIPMVAVILLNSAAALSVLFVIIGGARYLVSLGREEEFTKAKSTILWALLGLVVAVNSHRIVMAIVSQSYVTGSSPFYLELFATAVRVIVGLLNSVFLVVVIVSGMRMVMARGKEDEITKAKHALLYAIAGAVIINVSPFIVSQVLQL